MASPAPRSRSRGPVRDKRHWRGGRLPGRDVAAKGLGPVARSVHHGGLLRLLASRPARGRSGAGPSEPGARTVATGPGHASGGPQVGTGVRSVAARNGLLIFMINKWAAGGLTGYAR